MTRRDVVPQNTLAAPSVNALTAAMLLSACVGDGREATTQAGPDADDASAPVDTSEPHDTSQPHDTSEPHDTAPSRAAVPDAIVEQCHAYCHRSAACLTGVCHASSFQSPTAFSELCSRRCHESVSLQDRAEALEDAACDTVNAASCQAFPEVAQGCDCSGGTVRVPPCEDAAVAATVTGVHWVADDVLPGFVNGLVLNADGTMLRSVEGGDTCDGGSWSLTCRTATQGRILLNGCTSSTSFTFIVFQDTLQMISDPQPGDDGIAEYYWLTRTDAPTTESLAAMCPAGSCP